MTTLTFTTTPQCLVVVKEAARKKKQFNSVSHLRLFNEMVLGIVWMGLPLIYGSWITKGLRP